MHPLLASKIVQKLGQLIQLFTLTKCIIEIKSPGRIKIKKEIL